MTLTGGGNGLNCDHVSQEPPIWPIPPNTGGWLRTPRHRISCYLPEQEGDIYYLKTYPHEFYNCCDNSDYRAVREDLMRQMLEAVICATDPKPRRVASF